MLGERLSERLVINCPTLAIGEKLILNHETEGLLLKTGEARPKGLCLFLTI